MSFYRSILAAVAAVAIASPVFADDTSTTTTGSEQATPSAMTSDSSKTTTTTTTETTTKVNVNTASVKDLMKVKGLTKSNAKAIVAYRKAHGNFQNIDDLTSNIKGLKTSAVDQLTAE